jgi:hypothetical protein
MRKNAWSAGLALALVIAAVSPAAAEDSVATILSATGYGSATLFTGDTAYWTLCDSSATVTPLADLIDLGDGDFNDLVVLATGVHPVPEPGTMILLGSGALGLFAYARRRRLSGKKA